MKATLVLTFLATENGSGFKTLFADRLIKTVTLMMHVSDSLSNQSSPPLASQLQHSESSTDPDERPLPPDQVPQPPVREPRRRDKPGPPAPVKDARPNSPRHI